MDNFIFQRTKYTINNIMGNKVNHEMEQEIEIEKRNINTKRIC